MGKLASLATEIGLFIVLAAWALMIYQRRMLRPLSTVALAVLTLSALFMVLSNAHAETGVTVAALVLALLLMIGAVAIIRRLTPRENRFAEIHEQHRAKVETQRQARQ